MKPNSTQSLWPNNRFCEQFALSTPIALAPMALASGHALTLACARAGALGLLGGGYGDCSWLRQEYTAINKALTLEPELAPRLGCGFITWCLEQDASALDVVLNEFAPRSIMLSFGDVRPFAKRIHQHKARLICQVQNLAQTQQALEAQASVIVAQGMEAGGHGARAAYGRSTISLVPEIADYLAQHSPDTLLLAAGGIADGRGLAAACTLGADGVLLGSRLWVSAESLAPLAAQQLAIQSNGDNTVRSSIFDVLRRKNWPPEYDFRSLRNALHRRLENDWQNLSANPEPIRAEYEQALAAADYTKAHVTVGQATGLIADRAPAAEILARINTQALALLQKRID